MVRFNCSDWLLITSRRQLGRVLLVYVDPYNARETSLRRQPETARGRASFYLVDSRLLGQIQSRERLSGLINEYSRVARSTDLLTPRVYFAAIDDR